MRTAKCRLCGVGIPCDDELIRLHGDNCLAFVRSGVKAALVEGMVQYNLARCPNYGVFESPEWARAEELKEQIKNIEAKAKKRWEAGF